MNEQHAHKGLTPEDFVILQLQPMHRATRRADMRDAEIMLKHERAHADMRALGKAETHES